MNTQLQPEVANNKGLKGIVESASPVLDRVLGRASNRVTADWGLQLDERGRTMLQLKLSDQYGEMARDFALEELQDPDQASWRFRRLWSDLVREAFLRKMQAVETALASEE